MAIQIWRSDPAGQSLLKIGVLRMAKNDCYIYCFPRFIIAFSHFKIENTHNKKICKNFQYHVLHSSQVLTHKCLLVSQPFSGLTITNHPKNEPILFYLFNAHTVVYVNQKMCAFTFVLLASSEFKWQIPIYLQNPPLYVCSNVNKSS